MASTDEELVARSRGGDLDSFNQLVLRWERPIYALAQAPEGVDLVDLASEAEPAESIENLVARRELGRAVAKAMATLPDDQRTAIVLKEYHGLTFQEIADLLDCPLSTVKTRLYQGLTVVRKQLESAGVNGAALR